MEIIIDTVVTCAICGSKLSAEYSPSPNRNAKASISVEPCDTCIDGAKNEAAE